MGDLSRSQCDYVALATSGVRGLHPYTPGKPAEELERELGLSNIVKLASNENPLGPSPKAIQAIQGELDELARYPDGNGFKLKQALADKLGVDAAGITLGNGSNDILDLITRAYAEPGREVIYSQYAFAVYALSTQAVGATAVVTESKDWGHDLDAMAEAITDRTSLIFIANPNNPTGTWLSESALRAFMARVPEQVVVVLDEAYCEYIDLDAFPDSMALLRDYPNLVVTRTFSKAYGLAGLRIGFSISGEDIADVINRVRHPFNANSFALAAAVAALSDEQYLSESKVVNEAGLKQVSEGLEALGLEYIPSVGNFICFDTGGDGVAVYQKLLQHGVIVRPVANYGMPAHLRVSIGLESENARFLEVLAQVISSECKGQNVKDSA